MSTIRRWLDQFEKDGMITIRKIGQGGMIIKLVNFSRYQNLRNYRGCSTARNTSIDACTHDTGPNSSLQHDGVKHPRNTCETPAGHMDIDDLEDTYELDDQEGGPAEAEVAGDVGADPITRLAKHMVSTYIQVYQDVHEVTPSLPDHPMRRVKGAAKWLLGTYGDLSHEEILEKFAYQLRLHDPLPKLQFLSVDISPVMVRKARRTTKNNSKYPMVSRDINRNEENE